jgi:hypothetical protein
MSLRIVSFFTTLLMAMLLALSAQAADEPQELNPYDPQVEQTLKRFDKLHTQVTGTSPFVEERPALTPDCYQMTCHVFAHVVKAEQTLHLFIDGVEMATWLVSTGKPDMPTPDFDTHPSGRVYDAYDSSKYPDGDYKGLGNMPYSVFIQGGFAIHGTPSYHWDKLGSARSHGCVRLHPKHAYIFDRVVRHFGVRNTWITVD